MDLESDFESLEPRLQHLLFNKLRAENARLREMERPTRFCPSLDTQIYLRPNTMETTRLWCMKRNVCSQGCGSDPVSESTDGELAVFVLRDPLTQYPRKPLEEGKGISRTESPRNSFPIASLLPLVCRPRRNRWIPTWWDISPQCASHRVEI